MTTRRPINRSPLIPQQAAVVAKAEATAEVVDRINELLGDSEDPTSISVLEQINTEFSTT